MNKISELEKYKECLELRLALLYTDYAKKNEFEKNEIEILKIQTEYKIQKLNNLIFKENLEFQAGYEEYLRSLEFEDK